MCDHAHYILYKTQYVPDVYMYVHEHVYDVFRYRLTKVHDTSTYIGVGTGGVGGGEGGGGARCAIAPTLFLKVDKLDTKIFQSVSLKGYIILCFPTYTDY